MQAGSPVEAGSNGKYHRELTVLVYRTIVRCIICDVRYLPVRDYDNQQFKKAEKVTLRN